ncbi:MAG: hypothetical protein K5891_02155 [Lachnospiraceae bacterium]|nr:hypothetical protein [Lachnospiraceae bacterium]
MEKGSVEQEVQNVLQTDRYSVDQLADIMQFLELYDRIPRDQRKGFMEQLRAYIEKSANKQN